MAIGLYDLSDWESDFDFLERYVYQSESGYFPPDYLQEIEAYFQKYHREQATFRFERVSAMLRFLVANIQSFTVGGAAMPTTEAVEISDALRFALWVFFGMPNTINFDRNPDPQDVLAVAEDAEEKGFFPRESEPDDL